jgi:outer membrane protein OmpA-like peptidoglycan-associated protein
MTAAGGRLVYAIAAGFIVGSGGLLLSSRMDGEGAADLLTEQAVPAEEPGVELDTRPLQAQVDLADVEARVATRHKELDRLEELISDRREKLDLLEAVLREKGVELQQIVTAVREGDYRGLQVLSEQLAAFDPAGPPLALPRTAPGGAEDSGGREQAGAVEGLSADISKIQEVIHAAKLKANPAAEPDSNTMLVEILFESGSADLTIGGQTRAMAAAEMISGMKLDMVRIRAHTDTVGSASRNAALARARAEAVARIFAEAGLPQGAIEIVAAGEDANALPVYTPDGISEPLNRMVGIYPVVLTN